jgi:hypothetical protein
MTNIGYLTEILSSPLVSIQIRAPDPVPFEIAIMLIIEILDEFEVWL